MQVLRKGYMESCEYHIPGKTDLQEFFPCNDNAVLVVTTPYSGCLPLCEKHARQVMADLAAVLSDAKHIADYNTLPARPDKT